MGEERWVSGRDGMPPEDFPLERVASFGCYASCTPGDGCLYEFDEGWFWRMQLVRGAERERVEDYEQLPPGPWRHSYQCDCPACRAEA